MGFFDPAPSPPPPPPDYRTPPWLSPPDNVIPATVALDAVLVRRDDLAVWVADALAYPQGLAFTISVMRRAQPEPFHHEPPLFFGPPDPDGPRFGLQLADGTKVLAHGMAELRPLHEQPTTAILRPRSGGGGGQRSHTQMWLWPLPPPGPTDIVLTWPAQGVDEARVTVDGAAIVTAAQRAVEMWPDDRPLPPTEGDVLV